MKKSKKLKLAAKLAESRGSATLYHKGKVYQVTVHHEITEGLIPIDVKSPNKRTKKAIRAGLRLAKLATLSDESINFSDIPRTTSNDWENAERGKFSRLKTSQSTATESTANRDDT